MVIPVILGLLTWLNCYTVDDRVRIQGTWEIVSATEDGHTSKWDGARFIFNENTLTLLGTGLQNDRDAMRMDYSLDPTCLPKAIDTTHEIDPGKPIIQLGIYALSNDRLTLCLASAGEPRPTNLTGENGRRFELKRVTTRPSNESVRYLADGKVAVLNVRVSSDGTLAGKTTQKKSSIATAVETPRLPAGLGVRITPDGIFCKRTPGAKSIRLITYEQVNGSDGYGIYALFREKNPIVVPLPASGDPVRYPHLDHAQAMSRLLTLNGLDALRAEQVVATRTADWFADGLRIFFFVPVPLEQAFSSLALDKNCRVLVVCIEISRPAQVAK